MRSPSIFQISNFVKSVKIVKNKLHLAHLMYWYFLRKCEQYFDKNKTSVTQANEAMGQQLPLTAVNLQNLFHICQEISTVLHFRFWKPPRLKIFHHNCGVGSLFCGTLDIETTPCKCFQQKYSHSKFGNYLRFDQYKNFINGLHIYM